MTVKRRNPSMTDQKVIDGALSLESAYKRFAKLLEEPDESLTFDELEDDINRIKRLVGIDT